MQLIEVFEEQPWVVDNAYSIDVQTSDEDMDATSWVHGNIIRLRNQLVWVFRGEQKRGFCPLHEN